MKHIKLFSVIFGLLFLVPFPGLFGQDSFQSLIDKAIQLDLSADFQEALFILKKLENNNQLPDHEKFQVYIQLGESNYGLSNYQIAKAYFQKAYDFSVEKKLSSLSQAKAVLLLGDTQETLGALEEALNHFNQVEKILEVSQGAEKPDLLIQMNIGKGDYYDTNGEYAVSQDFYLKALELVNDTPSIDSMTMSKVFSRVGYSYFSTGDIGKALEYFEAALPIDLKYEGRFGVAYTTNLTNIAGILISKGDYDKALEYQEVALNNLIAKSGPEHFQLSVQYHNIGVLYLYKGEYALALEYFTRAKKIFNKKFTEEYHYLMTALNKNIGLCYEEMGEIDKALLYYDISLEKFNSNFPEGHAGTAKLMERIGRCKELEGSLDEAVDYHQRAIDMGEEFLGEDHHFVSRFIKSKGIVLKKKKAFKESKDLFLESSRIIKKQLGDGHPSLAENYRHLAELSLAQNNFTQGIAYYSDAEKILNFESNANFQNVNSEILLLEVFESKAKFYESLYEKSQDETNLEKALEVYTNIKKLIQYLRTSYKEDESKRILAKKNYQLYSNGIKVSLKLYELNKKEHYLEKAFQFSERLKANKILESFYATKAQNIAGIPDSILNLEKKYKVDIVYFKQTLDETLSADSVEIGELELKLLETKQAYQFFVNHLEADYPNYYNLKYSEKNLSVSQIQENLLANDQSLIEYHLGEENLFAFVIEKDRIRAIELELDSLQENILYLRKSLSSSFSPDANSPSLGVSKLLLKKYAFKLYQQLLEPLGELKEKVTIIPSGVIGTIPFEVLLSAEAAEDTPMNQLEYLIKKHEISYNFSALLWSEMSQKEYEEKGLLAVAPSFQQNTYGKDRNELEELKHTRTEAQYISTLFKGDTLIGNAATSTAFLNQAQNYGILHLATHAQVNMDKIEQSCLYFASDSSKNGNLYISDLYNLKFPTDLVVLSACETGVGELIKGEGIVSLARGFAYAGSSSIVTSLWRVRDNSTSEFMKLFYTNLKKGERKSEALRNAKLEFINSNPQYAHPFYWAPFVGIGNMQQIDNSDLPNALTYVFGILILGVLAYFFFWKERKAMGKEEEGN